MEQVSERRNRPAKFKRSVSVFADQADQIQALADREHEGNFSRALRDIVTAGLSTVEDVYRRRAGRLTDDAAA